MARHAQDMRHGGQGKTTALCNILGTPPETPRFDHKARNSACSGRFWQFRH